MVIFICQSVLFQFLGSIEKVIKLLALLYNLLKHTLCNIYLLRLQNCFQVASSYYCTTYYNHEVRYPEYYYHYYLGVIMTYSSPDFCAQYKQVAHNQKSIGYDVVPGSRAQIVCCTGLGCNGTKIFLLSHQHQDAIPTFIVRRQPFFLLLRVINLIPTGTVRKQPIDEYRRTTTGGNRKRGWSRSLNKKYHLDSGTFMLCTVIFQDFKTPLAPLQSLGPFVFSVPQLFTYLRPLNRF